MLTANRICMSYGQRTILSNVDLQVSPGDVVGIIGVNGAGKTTLFRILCNLMPPDSGEVLFTANSASRPLSHSDIGYLPESRSLFSEVTVDRTIRFWARLRGLDSAGATHACRLWLDRVGLLDRAPHRVSSLSKGNLQKLQLAACMLHEPRILILDEPFSGLDPANQIAVANLIVQAASEGTGVVLSAHHLDLLERIATRVFILENQHLKAVQSGPSGGQLHRQFFAASALPQCAKAGK